jgi:hypothetical protein
LRGQPFGVQASLSQVSAADVTEFRKWLNSKKLLPVIRPKTDWLGSKIQQRAERVE